MGFLPNASSSSDVQGERLHLIDPPVLMSIGTTVRTTLAGSNHAGKKRKRITTTLTTSTQATAQAAAWNEISDDSDVSSDDEKSLQNESHQQRVSIHKRRKGKGRRTVVFGDPSSTTRYYDSTITKAEIQDVKRDLWTTKQDRLRAQAECLEVLKVFRIQYAEEVMRFSDVYKTSMQRTFSQEASDFLEKATVSVPLTIRGMEWGISPKLKKRRKEHIRSVLALHKGIRDAELRARFVSNRSVQSSRGARIMARMIGEGDAEAGTISTALNVTPVPAKVNATFEQPLGEEPSNTKENQTAASKAIQPTKKTTKLGHARRKRKAVLFRK